MAVSRTWVACCCCFIYVAAIGRTAAFLPPSSTACSWLSAPSQGYRWRPSGGDRVGAAITTCSAKRSDRRKKTTGPLGSPPPPAADPKPAEKAPSGVPASLGDGSPSESSARMSSRASKGTGFGAARPTPTSKDVDEAYERALRKLKGTGSGKSSMSFDGRDPVDPTADQTTKKSIVTRNIDVFDLIPENIQLGFERVLIAALSLNLVVLIGLGIGFAFQALPAAKVDLPEGVEAAAVAVKGFVDQYEGLFSPSLVTFFIFSSLLGSFKVAQLGRGGTTTYTEYSEDEDGK